MPDSCGRRQGDPARQLSSWKPQLAWLSGDLLTTEPRIETDFTEKMNDSERKTEPQMDADGRGYNLLFPQSLCGKKAS